MLSCGFTCLTHHWIRHVLLNSVFIHLIMNCTCCVLGRRYYDIVLTVPPGDRPVLIFSICSSLFLTCLYSQQYIFKRLVDYSSSNKRSPAFTEFITYEWSFSSCSANRRSPRAVEISRIVWFLTTRWQDKQRLIIAV